jgi:putative transposase
MLVHKGFKYRLYPTPEQESQLLQQAGNTRFLWNKLLESNIKTYEETKKFQFSHEMIVSIPKLKEEFQFLKLSFSQSLQQVGRQLDKALKDFLNPKLDREFPVFKKRRNRDSFTVPQKFACNKNNVKLPKIGKVKWVLHRNWEGSPKFLTVSRDGSQWYCSITCEVNLPDKQLPNIETCQDDIVGIDVGLKEFATLSDNTVVPNPRHLNKKLKKLKREQRWLSRKTKGSHNRVKQIEKVQTVHRKVRNTRKDFLHKITSNMIAKYSGVILEDLNIRGMMKNSKLARHISDVGWYEFNRMLEYKSLWNAKHYIKIDRWFASSKICNVCGSKKVNLKLSDRIYVCEDCGNIVCRDFNASTNIRDEGIRILITDILP